MSEVCQRQEALCHDGGGVEETGSDGGEDGEAERGETEKGSGVGVGMEGKDRGTDGGTDGQAGGGASGRVR